MEEQKNFKIEDSRDAIPSPERLIQRSKEIISYSEGPRHDALSLGERVTAEISIAEFAYEQGDFSYAIESLEDLHDFNEPVHQARILATIDRFEKPLRIVA